APLLAAAADGNRIRVLSREIARRQGAGRGRSAQRDLDRVHHGQQRSIGAIAQEYGALDRRKTGPLRIVRKVSIELDGNVGGAVEQHARTFNVKRGVGGGNVHRQGKVGVAVGERAKGGFDGGEPILRAHQRGDLAPSQDQRRFRTETKSCSGVRHSHSFRG